MESTLHWCSCKEMCFEFLFENFQIWFLLWLCWVVSSKGLGHRCWMICWWSFAFLCLGLLEELSCFLIWGQDNLLFSLVLDSGGILVLVRCDIYGRECIFCNLSFVLLVTSIGSWGILLVLSLAFVLRISLGAVFWTFCIILILDDGSSASIEFA